jgi:hypothetical protein
MKELVAAELLQTRRGARGRLFVRLTELALGLETSHRPENRDGTIPTTRDGEQTALYKENQRNEPSAGANDFETFWKAYPKKRDRIKAQRTWNATASIRPPLQTLLSALATLAQSREWNDHDGKFIPYPSSWLNGRRWEEVSSADIPAQPKPRHESRPTDEDLGNALQYLKIHNPALVHSFDRTARWRELSPEVRAACWDIINRWDQELAGPLGWLPALEELYPDSWSPSSFDELKRQHPDIAAEVLAKLAAPATEEVIP